MAYRDRMGWTIPWVSSYANDFNFDYKVSSTTERPLMEYNFREVSEEARQHGGGELPGMSAFTLAGRRRVSHLLGVPAWPGRHVGHVSVARSCSARTQRDWPGGMVPTPRFVRGCDGVVVAHVAGMPVEETVSYVAMTLREPSSRSASGSDDGSRVAMARPDQRRCSSRSWSRSCAASSICL